MVILPDRLMINSINSGIADAIEDGAALACVRVLRRTGYSNEGDLLAAADLLLIYC
jgi:hypothetical protein